MPCHAAYGAAPQRRLEVAVASRAEARRRLRPALQTLILFLLAAIASAQKPENVLLVVNDTSPLSRRIAEYYVQRRSIPLANVCHIKTVADEEIPRDVYDREIAAPVAACLQPKGMRERILYIVATAGMPLKIAGASGMDGDAAAVDSELCTLYSDPGGTSRSLRGPLRNPFYARRGTAFSHPAFPMYLVTRLAAYDFDDVKALIDRSIAASNQGKFVIDLKDSSDSPGNDWLRNAAILLPKDRVIFDESKEVLYGQRDVIGYAAWGSNDKNRKRRMLGFTWLPGAIATEFVSTDGRTFRRPPDSWSIATWSERDKFFGGSPQSLAADFIHEGATGASGHVYEPYLQFTPHADYLLPAYYNGRNLAESFWVSIPAISWQNIVIGDPLCSLGKPR